MLTGLVVLIYITTVFVLFYYTYTYNTTSSVDLNQAVREVWSGECKQRCRTKKDTKRIQDQIQDASSSCVSEGGLSQLHSLSCSCQTCPCAAVENVIRSCNQTLTRAVLQSMNDLTNYLIDIVSQAYEYVVGTAEEETPLSEDFKDVTEDRTNIISPDAETSRPTTSKSPEKKKTLSSKSSVVTAKDSLTCKTCREKGNICIGNCPRAKKSDK